MEFGSDSEILKHLFDWKVLLNTKTMPFSTIYHDMDNMGHSVSWMYLHFVSFADQVVQNCKNAKGHPLHFRLPTCCTAELDIHTPQVCTVQPSRRQLSTAWSQPHCTSSIHTPSPLLHLSLVHEESVNDFPGIYILERSEKVQNCKLQFPQADYIPRNSPNFRTVFGIMIGPFSSCEIGKT